jgi:hypothetical protein
MSLLPLRTADRSRRPAGRHDKAVSISAETRTAIASDAGAVRSGI